MVQWDKDSCADAGFLKIDLLGLGMLSAVERCVEEIRACAASASTSRGSRSTTPQTFQAIRAADTVGVFQIESRAQMQSLLRTRPRDLDDLDDPGRDRAARADPGRRGEPLHQAAAAAARGPRRIAIPYDHPVARAGAARDAGHDHLPGPGDAGGGSVRRLHPRRGGRAAPGDEPQALGGDAASATASASSKARSRPRRAPPTARPPNGCGGWSRASPASAFPRRTAPPSACSPTSRPGCACTTARSSCARCSTSSRWASTLRTASSTRPRTAASPSSGSTSTPPQVQCTVERGAVRLGLGYIKACDGRRDAQAGRRARAGRALTGLEELAARSACRRVTLEQLAWSGACDGAARDPHGRTTR